LVAKSYRKFAFTVAIAVTYLTLPTITTMVFGLFPCDTLDTGESYLRSDYSIDCNGEERTAWTIYGALMIIIFPVGVTSSYWMLLWVDRHKIMQPVDVRELDEDLMTKSFLFDPYKPEFWFFEVIETVRRLMMTGCLGTVKPGSFTQLSAGLLMSIAYVVCISNLHPYVESRDNCIAILTGCQLVLVFMTAMFMKFQAEAVGGDDYDGVGMGAILITSYVATFVLFLVWAFVQKDDLEKSTNAVAAKTIKNFSKAVISGKSSSLEMRKLGLGGKVTNEVTNEVTETQGAEWQSWSNPLATGKGGGVDERVLFGGVEGREEEDVKPPAVPMKVTSQGLLAVKKQKEEVEDKEDVPPPPSLPPPGLGCPWTKCWDEQEEAYYYLHDDGIQSTWEKPRGYVE
jgi:uncharacterized membrane protein